MKEYTKPQCKSKRSFEFGLIIPVIISIFSLKDDDAQYEVIRGSADELLSLSSPSARLGSSSLWESVTPLIFDYYSEQVSHDL